MVYHVWILDRAYRENERFIRLPGTYRSRTSANRGAQKEKLRRSSRPARVMVLRCLETDRCSECRPVHWI